MIIPFAHAHAGNTTPDDALLDDVTCNDATVADDDDDGSGPRND